MESTEKKGKKLEGLFLKIKKNIKKPSRMVIAIIVSSLVVVFCFLGIVGLGAYRYDWNNKFVKTITKALPFPAAIVDGSVIKLSDWKYEVEGVMFYSEQRLDGVVKADVEKEVMDKMIMEKILEKMAKGYGVKVTDEDIGEQLVVLAEQVGGMEELENVAKEYFNWDLETFKQKILRPETLRMKLIEKISTSDRARKQAKVKADKVLAEVKSGDKDFADLAEEYSDDTGSAAVGGDLGYFPRGVMVQEFEDVAFSLGVGDVSDLVLTDFGYHIIKVNDHIYPEDVVGIDDGQTDEDLANTTQEEVSAQHILISTKGYDDILAEFEENARVHKFVALDSE